MACTAGRFRSAWGLAFESSGHVTYAQRWNFPSAASNASSESTSQESRIVPRRSGSVLERWNLRARTTASSESSPSAIRNCLILIFVTSPDAISGQVSQVLAGLDADLFSGGNRHFDAGLG